MKIVKASKNYHCNVCRGVIRKGNRYRYYEIREPRMDRNDKQVGINYVKGRICLRDMCDGVLKYVLDVKKYMKECSKGFHDYQYDGDPYGGGGEFCVNCGKNKIERS